MCVSFIIILSVTAGQLSKKKEIRKIKITQGSCPIFYSENWLALTLSAPFPLRFPTVPQSPHIFFQELKTTCPPVGYFGLFYLVDVAMFTYSGSKQLYNYPVTVVLYQAGN